MAINATQNRRIGPGGRTRRLHQPLMSDDWMNDELIIGLSFIDLSFIILWGRIRLDKRNKGVVFARNDTGVPRSKL